MKKRFLAWLLAAMLIAMCLPLAAQAAPLRTATVTGGWLRLRASASFDGTTLASYNTGTVVTVDAAFGKWYHVIAPDGLRGYMYGDYLDFGDGGGSSAPVLGTAYVTSTNGKGVRLRTGPGTGYSVIGLYKVGTQAEILARGTAWHYIRIGSHTGYMMNKYLRENTAPVTPAPTEGYTAYVTSANGKGVNLRKGPGKSYSSIGTYAVGTQVTVLQHNATWDYIQVGSRTGYMMNQYLTRTMPSVQVTSVSVSNLYPKVGETLTASVTPAGANVSYMWKDDLGTLLSTSPTCHVGAAQLGRRLYVYVTGVGLTTGSATSRFTNPVEYATGVMTPAPTGTPAPTNTPQAQEALFGSLQLPAAAMVGVTLTPAASLNTTQVRYQWYLNDMLIATGSSLKVESYMAGGTIRVMAFPTSSWYLGSVGSNLCEIRSVTTMTDLH